MYIAKSLPEKELRFTKADGSIYYGKFIDDFESFRKLRVLINAEELDFNLDQELSFKVYNPYPIDISLKKIKFGIAYKNDYKEVRDVQPVTASPASTTILSLKSNDTTSFTFKLPKTKMKDPGYFKIGISENGLHYGLNGANIKLN